MAQLFSAPFMQSFMQAWNDDEELVGALTEGAFSARIGYGFEDDDSASGILTVDKGRVTAAGGYAGETLDLDLRATEQSWQKWLGRRLDPLAVGTALASRQILNQRGDLAAVTAHATVARGFARSFAVLAKVDDGVFELPSEQD